MEWKQSFSGYSARAIAEMLRAVIPEGCKTNTPGQEWGSREKRRRKRHDFGCHQYLGIRIPRRTRFNHTTPHSIALQRESPIRRQCGKINVLNRKLCFCSVVIMALLWHSSRRTCFRSSTLALPCHYISSSSLQGLCSSWGHGSDCW